MTEPCFNCKHCTDWCEDQIGKYYWCEFDECWLSEEYATSELSCDMFEQKLDDHETKESSA